MTQVKDVMTGPVITVDPTASAAEAAQLMRDEDTGDVVVGRDGALTGIVTDRDLAVRLVAESLDPDVPVSQVLTSDPITVDVDDSVEVAAERMKMYSIRRLPVQDHGRVVGFISLGDLTRHIDTDETLSTISQSAPNW
ncbi:MAG TPA: CBS domain-containing protein [Actinomycetes bacterium]|nr:CBS domain-containing protein [Actinomycetes bacterium]